jgi:glyoxylase-like metal-dependent hydrolase (beta-lactamase superfamily II)
MSLQITTIRLPFPLKFSDVACYLIKNDHGFFLIDTGFRNSRRELEAELEGLGCRSGDLKMIILTHGDFDHTSNAVYLRQKYGAQIAMHEDDVGMLENGDMFWHRKIDNRLIRSLMKTFMPLKAENQGRPDIFLEDGGSLSTYGLEATVYNTPGHSTGSICVLTTDGDLFVGDLFTNSRGKPMLNSMMYDREAGISSLERLKSLPIQTVYPGHGKPFRWETLRQT